MNPLVSPSWLAARLSDPNTIVLDATLPLVGVTPPVDTRSRYLAKHLPGAVFFDIDELSDHATLLPHMLQTPEEFSRNMSVLGISSDMTAVVYEQEGVFSAPRAWWMLRTYGMQNVFILYGGLRAWTDAGLPTESGLVQRMHTTFAAHLHSEAVKDFSQIQQMIASRVQTPPQILDARSAARFSGSAPEPRPGISSGHMPGATNIPYTELTEDGRLKTAEKLRSLFAAKSIDLSLPITTTCGSGVTAAVIALALEVSGARDVTLYDGSWAEYAQQPDAVIRKG